MVAKRKIDMDSLDNLVGKQLYWSMVKDVGLVLHPQDSQQEIAALTIKGKFGSSAEGRCGQEKWNFIRTGLLQNNISVLDSVSKKEIALFKKKGLGGKLTMQDSKVFSIERNALMTEYTVLLNQSPLIKFYYEQRPLFVMQPASIGLLELPLLIVFLAYLIIMQRIDANFSFPF